MVIGESLVVAQVEIGLRAVIGHVDLAMLERDSSCRDRRSDTDRTSGAYPQPTLFEQQSDRGRGDSLAERGDDASGDEDVLGHCIRHRRPKCRDGKAQLYEPPPRGMARWRAQGAPMAGKERIIRQAEYVNDKQIDNVTFLPVNGCPGPEVIDFAEQIRIIILDSQWWFQDETLRPQPSDSLCSICTEGEIIGALESVLNASQDKFVVIAGPSAVAADSRRTDRPSVLEGGTGGGCGGRLRLLPPHGMEVSSDDWKIVRVMCRWCPACRGWS